MLEPIAVMLQVIEALDDLGVPYLIGGSMASAVHGVYRATADVDIVADLRHEHVAPLVARLDADFYIEAEDIRDAITQRRVFNVIHLTSMFKVDIYVLKNHPFDRSQFTRRAIHMIAINPDRPAWLASPEDTILAKLDWHRRGGGASDRQWGDILGVLRVQGMSLDLAYLRQWAVQLDVSDALERALVTTGLADRSDEEWRGCR